MAFIFISGGSASGKSELAEEIARKCGGAMTYIATMKVWDEESRKRVQKHQMRRAADGYKTIEMPIGLNSLAKEDLPERGTVLLECMSNLAANEIFEPDGSHEKAFNTIIDGVKNLISLCDNLIVVSNEVFSDGTDYGPETRTYLYTLGKINCVLVSMADHAAEVSCGCAQWHKGGSPF